MWCLVGLTRFAPCLEAARTGEMMRVSIAEVAERWPDFARDAGAAGFGSFLSAPLAINDDQGGRVNCYSGHRGGFAELDEKLQAGHARNARSPGENRGRVSPSRRSMTVIWWRSVKPRRPSPGLACEYQA